MFVTFVNYQPIPIQSPCNTVNKSNILPTPRSRVFLETMIVTWMINLSTAAIKLIIGYITVGHWSLSWTYWTDVSIETFAMTEFNEIFSGRQPRRDVYVVPAHSEDGDGVSSRNVGKLSHLETTVCPRKFPLNRIYCPSLYILKIHITIILPSIHTSQ